ncbi:MAG: phosphatidyl serine synthase-domain-containing protein, partial [Olpidium bornovanus]
MSGRVDARTKEKKLLEFTETVLIHTATVHPRTLTVLVLMLGGFLYYALWKEADTVSNTKITRVLKRALCGIHLLPRHRASPISRWCVHTTSPCALASRHRLQRALSNVSINIGGQCRPLVVGVFDWVLYTKEDARKLFAFYDPNLGVELPERSYADNCEITLSNIMVRFRVALGLRDPDCLECSAANNQLDIFVVAHAVGWFCKAIILRDYWLCWVLSVMFEIMEYSLQHHLPNFGECWWDHWIVDVLTCNWLGTYVGMKTCEFFEMKASTRIGNFVQTLEFALAHFDVCFQQYSWR